MRLLSFGRSDAGCVRQHNEDRILFDDALQLYVVCDGIGGRRGGEVAAQIATDCIREAIATPAGDWPYGYEDRYSRAGNRLRTAVQLASRQVWKRAEDSLALLGMGATVAAVLIEETRAAIANIGDSRVYRFRTGGLERLSVDDAISIPAAAGAGSGRTMLTRSAGAREDTEVHLAEVELAAGDALLLCSDGLHGYVAEERIAAILSQPGTPDSRTAALVAAARAVGAPDNVSAVLVELLPNGSELYTG